MSGDSRWDLSSWASHWWFLRRCHQFWLFSDHRPPIPQTLACSKLCTRFERLSYWSLLGPAWDPWDCVPLVWANQLRNFAGNLLIWPALNLLHLAELARGSRSILALIWGCLQCSTTSETIEARQIWISRLSGGPSVAGKWSLPHWCRCSWNAERTQLWIGIRPAIHLRGVYGTGSAASCSVR